MVSFFELSEAFAPGVMRLGLRNGRWISVEGRVHADLLGTESVETLFVSQRFLEIAAGLRGWTAGPSISIADRNAERSRCTELVVTGRCGPVGVPRASVISESDGIAEVSGIQVAHSTWDGSDFFRPEGTTFILVASRAEELIRAAALSNVVLVAAAKVRRYVPSEQIE